MDSIRFADIQKKIFFFFQLGAVLDEVSVDLTKSTSELGTESRTEIEQSQDGEIKEKSVSDKTTSDLINQSEGNSNDSESYGQKLNGLDAKFKVFFKPSQLNQSSMYY